MGVCGSFGMCETAKQNASLWQPDVLSFATKPSVLVKTKLPHMNLFAFEFHVAAASDFGTISMLSVVMHIDSICSVKVTCCVIRVLDTAAIA